MADCAIRRENADVPLGAGKSGGTLPGRDVTVFSDGEVGMTHILHRFHLSMRLRHIEQA
jgi:hypothetical protein